MLQHHLHRAASKPLARLAAVGFAYFLAARLGLTLASINNNVTAVWPASGIALAAVLVLGRRVLPAVWLGQCATNFLALRAVPAPVSGSVALAVSACIATAGTLGVLVGAACVKRYAGPQFLGSGRGMVRFLLLSGPLSCAVAATVGPVVLCLGGAAEWREVVRLGLIWWTGDSIGVVAFAPMLLAWHAAPRVTFRPARFAEAGALAAALLACTLGVFVLSQQGSPMRPVLALLGLPMLAWTAMRFGPRGAATAVMALSTIALFATLNGSGPFAGSDLQKSLTLLQLYVGVVTGTMLVVAAVAADRQAAGEALLSLNQGLEGRIRARTAEMEAANQSLRTQVSERERAEEALRRERDRLSSVLAVQEAIAAAAPDLDAVLRMIVTRARDLLGASAAALAFAEGEVVAYRVSTEPPEKAGYSRLRIDASLTGHCLTTGRVVFCNDTLADARADQGACLRSGGRSLILVPLCREGRPAAVLAVYSHSPGAFQPADATALQLMAGFLEGVMAHAVAFEEKRSMLTDLTATVEALREAQDRFVAFMDNSPAVAFMKDHAGRVAYLSAAFRSRMVPPGQDWIGRTNGELFSAAVADQLDENDRAVLREGKVAEFIESAPDREGRLTHWLVHKFPFRDRTGRLYLAGQAVDITERLEAEHSLRDSQERLTTALAASQTGTYHWDIAADRVDADEEMCRLFGNVPASTLQSLAGWLSCIHPEDRPAAEAHCRQVVEEGVRFDMCYRVVWPDGSTRWLQDKGRLSRDGQGRPLYVSGACVDVTECKRFEQALAASERFARATVDALTTEMAILDQDGRIIGVNRAWRQFAAENGLANPDAAVGLNYLEVCHAAEGGDTVLAREAARGIRSVMAGEQDTFCLEYPCHGPDARRWFTMQVTRFESDGVTRLVVAHENITSRKLAEQLDLERVSLREAVGAMEQVLGVVGHELRTPLAALQAISEFLLTDGARETEEWERFLRDMNEEVRRMSDTVNNILEAARLNSGRARWNWGAVDLVEACRDAVETIRPLVDPDSVDLSFVIEPSVRRMRGDAEAIRRLVVNLLSNARKHTRRGAIRVEVCCAERDGIPWARLSVADTGVGMPSEILARLGEAFALNAGVVGASYVGGTGLGLAICKGIVAAHGGEVRFASEQGKGTTVTALLRTDLAAAVQGDTRRDVRCPGRADPDPSAEVGEWMELPGPAEAGAAEASETENLELVV